MRRDALTPYTFKARLVRWLAGAATWCALMALVAAPIARASTLEVACGDVSGLASAILQAENETSHPGPDTISLSTDCTYMLETGGTSKNAFDIIDTDVTVEGNGATIERAAGTPDFRFFLTAPSGTLTLRDLSLVRGAQSDGGAIFNRGTLSVIGTSFTSNVATRRLGGAIYSLGPLTIERSSFTDNSAFTSGGALGIEPPGVATVLDSTFTSNSSSRGGAVGTSGDTTVEGSTFLGNTAVKGGGIRNFGELFVRNSTFVANDVGGIGNSETATVINSTFSGNAGTTKIASGFANIEYVLLTQYALVTNNVFTGSDAVCSGKDIEDGGGNVTWPGTACFGLNADPRLGPLQDNGGPTSTMLPGLGSAALDVGVELSCPATDQRGISRPQGPGCDAGAVEIELIVDTEPPLPPSFVEIPTDPSGPMVRFSFTHEEPGVTFTCSLDGAAPSACNSPHDLAALDNGGHLFDVRAIDAAGNVSAPASLSWLVDAIPPPVPTFTQTPPDPSSADVTFAFTDEDPSAGLTCSLDGATPSTCASPLDIPALPAGPHTFEVRAVDAVGNVSDAATFAWTVEGDDTTPPPNPTFTQTPPDPSSPDVSLAFVDAESGVSFTCSLDGASPGVCSSPVALVGLASGGHTFEVRAVDRAGNVSSPAILSWDVDATPPTVTMTQPVADSLLTGEGVNVVWTGSDDRAVVRYDVLERTGVSGPQALVQSGPQTTYSRPGTLGTTYCYTVIAIDSVGNSGVGQERCTAVPHDDRSSSIVYTGAVSQITSSGPLAGTLTALGGAGQQAKLSFTGRKVGVLARKDASSGLVDVYIDGVFQRRIDLYNASPRDRVYIVSRALTPGTHSITLAWTGMMNASSTGSAIRLDGIAVVGD